MEGAGQAEVMMVNGRMWGRKEATRDETEEGSMDQAYASLKAVCYGFAYISALEMLSSIG